MSIENRRREFEAGCDRVEVTSLHRPDTHWSFVDPAGHLHRWFVQVDDPKVTGGTLWQPATDYRPEKRYQVATTVRVQDPSWYDEDGEEVQQWHLECAQCGARVSPGYTADSFRQFVPGIRWFRIDGVSVDEETFKREVEIERSRHEPRKRE